MSSTRNVYVGPMLVVKTVQDHLKKKIRACANVGCDRRQIECQDRYCRGCGQALSQVVVDDTDELDLARIQDVCPGFRESWFIDTLSNAHHKSEHLYLVPYPADQAGGVLVSNFDFVKLDAGTRDLAMICFRERFRQDLEALMAVKMVFTIEYGSVCYWS